MHVSHPLFKAPPNLDGKIWQYMDLAQFVSMLQRNQLFFVKANQLRDPYEGTMPQYNNPTPSSEYKEPDQPEQFGRFSLTMSKRLKKHFEDYREMILINSWHYNEYESAAMWQLYSQENAGIAIQSTANRLAKCFANNSQDTIWIGKVDYLDYSKELDKTNKWNPFEAFVIKRKSFEYENEVRAITCLPLNGHIDDGKLPSEQIGQKEVSAVDQPLAMDPKDLTDKGKYVSANLQILIENVYIAPFSEPWFKEVVESLLSKYELKANVIKSDLYTVY